MVRWSLARLIRLYNLLVFSSPSFSAHKHECPEELLSENYLNFDEIIPISAKTKHNVEEVKDTIRNVLDKHALKKQEESSETVNQNQTNKLRST